jgi:hypothetical protein
MEKVNCQIGNKITPYDCYTCIDIIGGFMTRYYSKTAEKERTMRLRRSNLTNPYYENMMRDLAKINTQFALGLIDFFNAQHRLTLKQRAAAEKTIAAYKKANK